MKRIKLCILLLFLFENVYAQPGKFSIVITQVYPAGGIVYGNTYNLSSEHETAIRMLSKQYSGKDANYKMELTRPSGKETKVIQNINWILIENGLKKNFKNKPAYDHFYPHVTSLELYACNNNGSKKEHPENNIIKFDYYYKIFLNGQELNMDASINYRTFADCKVIADSVFSYYKPLIDTVLFEVRIYNDNEIRELTNNRTEFEQNQKQMAEIKKQQQALEQIQTEKANENINAISCQETLKILNDKLIRAKKNDKPKIRNEIFTIAMNCISAEYDYDWENINENLILCQKVAKEYLMEDENFLPKLNQMIEKLDQITSFMKNNTNHKSIQFDRNKYFNSGKRNSLIKGIDELIKINKTLK